MRSQIIGLILLLLSMAMLILSDEQVVMASRPSIKRIDEDLDIDQGYDVNLRRPEKFGKELW
jgi:hypothetical protein